MAVCREMGRFFLLLLVCLKVAMCHGLRLYMSLDSISSMLPAVVFWRAVEMLNLHQTSNQNLWVSHLVTHKTHRQTRCHLVFVSFMGSGKLSYFHFPARKLGPRGSVTLQRTFWCEPHVCKQCLCRVCRQHHPILLSCTLHKYRTPVQKHGYSSFSLRAMAFAQDGFQHIILTLK